MDYLRLLCVVEIAIVSALYLRTTYHGFLYARQYEENRPFNMGRALACAAVIVSNAAFVVLLINRWGEDFEPPYFFLIFLANVLYLFGWVYSVRITLKKGRPDA